MADGRLIFDTKIDTNGFEQGLTSLGTKTQNMTGSVIKGIIGSNLITGAGKALIDFGKDSITAASDLQEVDNVIQVTFGENAPLIDAFAKKATASFGMTETAAKRYTGVFGSILKAMGMTDTQTLEFSQNLTGLAADLASFYNIDFETAYQKLRSGLVGETEPLMHLGIDLRVSALEEYAESIGLAYDELDSAGQAALRYAAIMDKTTDVQGDFARTGDSFSNQMKLFETNIANLQAILGEQLLPVANSVLQFFNGLFETDQKELTAADKLKDVTEQFEEFNAAAKAAEENFKAAEDTLEGRAMLAETYMDTLEILEGKEIKTDADIAAINNAITALNNLYPDLKATMDPATGSLNMNTQAIRDNIAALQNLAMQNLFSDQQTDLADRHLKAFDDLAAAMIVLEDAQEPFAEVENKISGVQGVLQQLYENNFSGVNAYFGQYADLITGFNQFFQQQDDGSWIAIEGAAANVEQLVNNTEAALVNLNAEREDLANGISEAQAAVDGYNQAIADIDAEISQLAEKQDRVKQLMTDMGGNAAEAEADGIMDNAGVVENAMAEVNEKAADVDTGIYFNQGRKSAHQFAMGLRSVSMPTLSAGTSSGSGTDGSHATGLNYVPYDNYIARLHVGEAVLNAKEARAWRSGELAAASGADLPSAAYASPKAKTIINIDGQKVAEIQGYNNSRQIAIQNNRHAKGVGSR